jgi:hypothetical protein
MAAAAAALALAGAGGGLVSELTSHGPTRIAPSTTRAHRATSRAATPAAISTRRQADRARAQSSAAWSAPAAGGSDASPTTSTAPRNRASSQRLDAPLSSTAQPVAAPQQARSLKTPGGGSVVPSSGLQPPGQPPSLRAPQLPSPSPQNAVPQLPSPSPQNAVPLGSDPFGLPIPQPPGGLPLSQLPSSPDQAVSSVLQQGSTAGLPAADPSSTANSALASASAVVPRH